MGAPRGGRVHWLALMLPRILQNKYDLNFDYDRHNYRLTLKGSRKRFDEYIIIRTSQKCYRVSYYDNPTRFMEYQSYRKAEDVIDYIIYRFQKKYLQELDYRNEISTKLNKRKSLK